MKKLLTYLLCIITFCACWKLLGYVQTDYKGAVCVSVNADKVGIFKTADDKTWEYKLNKDSKIKRGDTVVLSIFDCENMNPSDDYVVDVKIVEN